MMKSSVTTTLLVLLAPAVVQGLNFGSLQTPVIDWVNRFVCGANIADGEVESPLCSWVPTAPTEEESAAAAEEGGLTVGAFMRQVSCDMRVLPATSNWCFSEEEQETILAAARDEEGIEEDRIVDKFFLNMLCGENGFATRFALSSGICTALVGEDGNSGLLRTLCESGVMWQPACTRFGIEQPSTTTEEEGEDGGDGGRARMLLRSN